MISIRAAVSMPKLRITSRSELIREINPMKVVKTIRIMGRHFSLRASLKLLSSFIVWKRCKARERFMTNIKSGTMEITKLLWVKITLIKLKDRDVERRPEKKTIKASLIFFKKIHSKVKTTRNRRGNKLSWISFEYWSRRRFV